MVKQTNNEPKYRDTITTPTDDDQDRGPSLIWKIIAALLAVAIFWSIGNYITEDKVIFANVNGASMEYSLLNGEHVMIEQQAKPHITRGNIIAFSANAEDPLNPRIGEATKKGEDINYVKRIVALPGDTIEGKEDGLYVNGEKVDEYYLANKYKPFEVPWTIESLSKSSLWADDTGATTIPEGNVFVLGDNREISEDSRYFGFVNITSIIGDVKTLPWNDGPLIEKGQ